jgi:hypothetical protein
MRRDPQSKREICNSATLKPGFRPFAIMQKGIRKIAIVKESHTATMPSLTILPFPFSYL